MGLAPYQVPPGAIVSVEDAAASQANARTEQKLQHPQEAQFEGVSFRDVLGNLAEAGGIDIVTDDKVIGELGVDLTATAITMKVHEPRPLGQVLELALRLASRDLDYALVNGVIFVSTRAELNRHVITRAYRVNAEGDRNELTNLILNTLGRSEGIQLAYLGDKLIVTAPEPSQRELAKLLALLGDQVSRPNQFGQPGHNQSPANPSADRQGAAVNEMLPKMQELADQAVAISNKLGPRSPEMQSIARQLDALGQQLEVIGEQMSREGREGDVTMLKGAMDKIKATLAPLRSESEPTAPAPIAPPVAK